MEHRPIHLLFYPDSLTIVTRIAFFSKLEIVRKSLCKIVAFYDMSRITFLFNQTMYVQAVSGCRKKLDIRCHILSTVDIRCCATSPVFLCVSRVQGSHKWNRNSVLTGKLLIRILMILKYDVFHCFFFFEIIRLIHVLFLEYNHNYTQ